MKKLISIVLLLCMLIGVFSLSASATDAAPTAIDLEAAEAYWADYTTGQFIVNADATVYEIATAEQLMGLSMALENGIDDETWTKGKTFKLICDIDLNPGIDWVKYRQQMMDEEYTGETQTPVNVWLGFDKFYGVFDGQGHTIKGFWALEQSYETADPSEAREYGLFGGRMFRGSAVKNVIIDDGFISGQGTNAIGGIAGVFIHDKSAKDDKTTLDDGILVDNVYFGKNFTMDFRKNTNKQAGAVASSFYFLAKDKSTDYTLDATIRNYVFAGHFAAGGFYSGPVLGQWTGWAINQCSYNITLTDSLVTGTYEGIKPDGVEGKSPMGAKTVTDSYDFGNGATQSIPEGKEDKFVMTTSYGMLPVATANMFAKYSYQATTATDNKYSIRLIGEIASLNYKSVDFKVKITKASGGTSADWGYGADGYTNAKTVYTSLIANNETVTPADLNKGIIDGENSRFYVLTLNDLDVNETYTITVSTVWTLTDGNVVESASTKTLTPEPWVAE